MKPTTDVVIDISIRAPRRGATENFNDVYDRTDISIHAPIRGAMYPRRVRSPYLLISIPAPIGGATCLRVM
ncbi:hypothetical protein [Bacillus thuringiensis]|uniref:hypothetical protein n=1 Tax=Bacillus thuringiensis TaxID=1428 RepID=UPI000BF4395B|nr:hypothetical protein [Bacillus thuringiensis]PFV48418.1 hypothetical protein COL14_18740 [Bacillus thuringiensis]